MIVPILDILYNLLLISSSYFIPSSTTPVTIPCLIRLIQYKLQQRNNYGSINEAIELRKNCKCFLSWISERVFDHRIYPLLSENGYTKVVTLTTRTCGRVGTEDDKEINRVLIFMHNFSSNLCIANRLYPTFMIQPALIGKTDEQYDDQGTIEEIESQLFNDGYKSIIKHYVQQAKNKILNCSLDFTNEPNWM
ncbi:MAG: hypothetical protein EZS28_021567 [Streblomastix strix]|uniref:Uncharacterized protein n=1 Tax=Streblomastix strix TaxID=222440 RepID=A0A5J4VKC1_9EUKA|nr:MAG: hypothetical protein EZS28_021567 [Streblomastix strix]